MIHLLKKKLNIKKLNPQKQSTIPQKLPRMKKKSLQSFLFREEGEAIDVKASKKNPSYKSKFLNKSYRMVLQFNNSNNNTHNPMISPNNKQTKNKLYELYIM